jgi:hypothetical protein
VIEELVLLVVGRHLSKKEAVFITISLYVVFINLLNQTSAQLPDALTSYHSAAVACVEKLRKHEYYFAIYVVSITNINCVEEVPKGM